MLITMLETRQVSEDAFTVRCLEKGETYDIADMAARMAIRSGWAIRYKKEDEHGKDVTVK